MSNGTFRLAIIAILAMGTLPAVCQAAGQAEALAAAAIALRADSSGAIVGKAVPKADKATGELIGTVTEAIDLGVICGVRATFVILAVSKPYPFIAPAGVTCPGNSLAATCRGLRAGQRVRLQGNIGAVPDPTAAGFVACDPGTWEAFQPSFAFGVTKVFR